MTRIVLPVPPCSQMSNPKSGTGTGRDQCTEACGAMMDKAFQIGPQARAGVPNEQLMREFTEWLNHGSDTSALEPFGWVAAWIEQHSEIKVPMIRPAFNDLRIAISGGHPVIMGVRDYRKLRLADGGNPYQWYASKASPAGHELVGVGFDDEQEQIIVNDPLRADGGQPAAYSIQSIAEAGWSYAAAVGAPTNPNDASTATASLLPTPPHEPSEHIYVVQPGDYLSKIAAMAPPDGYGDGDKWPLIYEANKTEIGSNPDLIKIGMKLVIPPAA